MRQIKRAVHLDFHTMPGIVDFNVGWDPAAFAETLKNARVCYINAFAKCNLGFAYYKTKVGIPYPGMRGDMFGDLLRECHARGIGVSAYMNVGLDHELASRDMGMCKLDADGHVISGDRTAWGFRQMCCGNPGYREYLLGMVREIARYDIDGFFADCMFNTPCYCSHCLADRKARGLAPYDPATAAEHAQQVWLEFSRECKQIIGPDRRLIFNNVPYHLGRDLHTHAEVECLPAGWSYDYFWPHAVYNRTVMKEVLYMTGRFQSTWGDFGGFKSKESLENDYYDALCVGAGIMVGDHMHPAGNLEPDIYNTIGELNTWLETLEPWTEKSVPYAEIGVVTDSRGWLQDTYWGLTRMFCELKLCFEIVNTDACFSKYKLLVLPDRLMSTPELAHKLKQFINAGGKVLSTGSSGLSPDQKEFILPDWDFEFCGMDRSNSSYFHIASNDDPKVCDMDYNMYSENGVLFKPRNGNTVLADYVKAYFNRHWDGFHGYFYTPPEKQTEHAAAAISGNVCQISFEVFSSYYVSAAYANKSLVKKCIDILMPQPMLKTENIPSTARVTAADKGDEVLLHVKATYPEVRGMMYVIEEHSKLMAGAAVYVRGEYSSAYSVPVMCEVSVEQAPGGYTKVVLPEVHGYRLFALRKAGK